MLNPQLKSESVAVSALGLGNDPSVVQLPRSKPIRLRTFFFAILARKGFTMNPREFIRGIGFILATALPWALWFLLRGWLMVVGPFALLSKGGF